MVSVTVEVSSASKDGKKLRVAPGLPVTLSFPDGKDGTVTARDVKRELAKRFPRFYPERQRLLATDTDTGKPLPLEDGAVVDSDSKLAVKDLGPQISWRTVFIVEYLGPLLIHPLLYHFPQYFYRAGSVSHDRSRLQTLTYALVMIYFLKRELETVFVHRFSKATMPRNFIFRNSAHYWLVSGVGLALTIYSSRYSPERLRGTLRDDPRFLAACVAFWTWAELSNLYTHLALRALRAPGSTQRGIPRGYGFALVSYPNYLFDLLAWLALYVMTGATVAGVFVAVSTATLTSWAVKKHKAYKREFGDAYPRGRKAIIPFLI